MGENVEKSWLLQKRETELLKEELILANAKIARMQIDIAGLHREMNPFRKVFRQLQQQVMLLAKRCSDLETNELKADRTLREKERRIKQLETQIATEARIGRDIKFPGLAPSPFLRLAGRVSVRDIQLKTRDWLKIRENWFIRWQARIRDIVNWWGSRDHIPDTRDRLYQKIREWIRTLRHGVELYIEFHGQLIRHYKFVKRLPRSTRKALKWSSLRELDVRIGEVRLNKKVLEQGGDEEVSNLQSWLYNQTWGRVGVEGTMRKYLVTAADGRVDWLKKMLNLEAAKNQLAKILIEI
ncbi:hypothetical protein LOTGIDRAFT_172664 [Lottia gigantea]|uniref:Uncharacterized protein n=1 Tax=Lottia gigantea TaxID=225164 RepID=V4ABY3_LOTGI|nr:hypothetical protein LOTGIDRAFT_172664 [Lottia gigantea]ESP01494.1 hypothetical protein LOTGIDRAFT_172664 [Lottia gigantea]